MTDIVIPLGDGSIWQNNELRYCLRSIARFMRGVGIVWVIGERPDFLSEAVVHIPAEDNGRSREENILNKILIACDRRELSKEFLLFNDDFFLMKKTYAAAVPHYYHSTLEHFHSTKINGRYKNALANTIADLQQRGLPTRYYDIHVPVLYEKERFRDIMWSYDWNKPDGYVIKSLYCNTAGVHGVSLPDLKIAHPVERLHDLTELIGDRFMFSVHNGGLNWLMMEFLQRMFPERCIYEN